MSEDQRERGKRARRLSRGRGVADASSTGTGGGSSSARSRRPVRVPSGRCPVRAPSGRYPLPADAARSVPLSGALARFARFALAAALETEKLRSQMSDERQHSQAMVMDAKQETARAKAETLQAREDALRWQRATSPMGASRYGGGVVPSPLGNAYGSPRGSPP